MSKKPTPIFLIENENTKATSEELLKPTRAKKRNPCKHYRVTTDEERVLLVQHILGQGLTIKEVKTKFVHSVGSRSTRNQIFHS